MASVRCKMASIIIALSSELPRRRKKLAESEGGVDFVTEHPISIKESTAEFLVLLGKVKSYFLQMLLPLLNSEDLGKSTGKYDEYFVTLANLLKLDESEKEKEEMKGGPLVNIESLLTTIITLIARKPTVENKNEDRSLSGLFILC